MDSSHETRQDVRASIWFLEESELYKTVKPYTLTFTPEAQIPRENIKRTEVPVLISDLRGSEKSYSLDHNGFMVLGISDGNDKVDWDDKEMVKIVHYPTVVSELERAFPGARCIPLNHKVNSKLCVLAYRYSQRTCF